MEHSKSDYLIDNVYLTLDTGTRQEIIDLWTGERVLDLVSAKQRVNEVVCTIRNPQGRLIGVNTVYPDTFQADGNRYYFMRAFIQKSERGVWGLILSVLHTTVGFLKEHGNAAERPEGIIMAVENKKLWRKGAHHQLKKHGWTFLGAGPRGNQIWYVRFDGLPLPC